MCADANEFTTGRSFAGSVIDRLRTANIVDGTTDRQDR